MVVTTKMKQNMVAWMLCYLPVFLQLQGVTAIFFSQTHYDAFVVASGNITEVTRFYVFPEDHETNEIYCAVADVTSNMASKFHNDQSLFSIDDHVMLMETHDVTVPASFNATIECSAPSGNGSWRKAMAYVHIRLEENRPRFECGYCLEYVPSLMEVLENVNDVTIASIFPLHMKQDLSDFCSLHLSTMVTSNTTSQRQHLGQTTCPEQRSRNTPTDHQLRISPNGEVRLVTPLDSEQNDVITLKWVAKCRQGRHHRHHCTQVTSQLRVRDRDDNAPKYLSGEIQTSFKQVKAGQKLLAGTVITEASVLDVDFHADNNYTVTLAGPDSEILEAKNLRKRDYPNERRTKRIFADIVLTKDLIMNATKTLNYILTFNDTSMTSPEGQPSATAITLNGTHYYYVKGVPTSRGKIKPTTSPAFPSSPGFINITMFTGAAPYTQLHKITNDSQFRPERSYEQFIMENTKGNDILGDTFFGVTPQQGIIYLKDKNPEMLQNITLTIRNKNEDGQVARTIFVQITLTRQTKENKWPKKGPRTCDQSCSEFRWKTDCESNCGVGARQGKCRWTTLPQSHDPFETCTPFPATCPDGVCDELERTFQSVCPQDCVFNATNKHGTCYCPNSTWCLCKHLGPAPPPVPDQPYEAERSTEQKYEDEKPSRHISSKKGYVSYPTGSDCNTVCRIGVVLGACCAVVFVSVLVWRIRHRRKTNRKGLKTVDSTLSLSRLPSDYVDERDMTINVGGTISYQGDWAPRGVATKLPSDPKWEFPRKNLILGETLGEGEFGKVVKAHAFNIDGKQGFTTVAVKMLKPCASASEFRDLWSEYNLLKDVYHRNVVKLLGACTQNGPFYVIVEHCALGSLRTYLRRHRRNGEGSDVTYVEGQEPPPEGSEPEVAEVVSSKDLLSFAWQISKGMEYLAETKVVHRDLAARNILVASGKVIKISDFGLSRDVYEEDTYLKKSKGRIPVKWMAPESLYEHTYTKKSDVWSFGVVLWEIVSLGATPYPGVTSERLYQLLKSGYRMTRPASCSEDLFHVMQKCWENDPCERPNFRQLSQTLENMMQQNVAYLELSSLEEVPPNVKDTQLSSGYQDTQDTHCISHDGRTGSLTDVDSIVYGQTQGPSGETLSSEFTTMNNSYPIEEGSTSKSCDSCSSDQLVVTEDTSLLGRTDSCASGCERMSESDQSYPLREDGVDIDCARDKNGRDSPAV